MRLITRVATLTQLAAKSPKRESAQDASGHTPRSVLVVNDTLSDNGSLRWALELTRLWVRSGWSIAFFSLKSTVEGEPALPLSRLSAAGIQLLDGAPAGARYRRALPRILLRALRASAAADVVLVCSEVPFSVPVGYLVARLTRRPFVLYVQSIADHSFEVHLRRWERRPWRHCLRHADAVLCVSSASAESAARLGVAHEKITVAPTGIDVDAVRQRASADCPDHATPGERRRLVACGELHPRKGYDILVRAFARVVEAGYQVELVLIGRGPERTDLVDLARDLGVSDGVIFLGQVENPLPEIARAYAFVHSARVEAVGLVLLEAIALGVPTIAADCAAGGPRMVLDGGRLGRLVATGSVSALADAICAHLDNPAELRLRARQGPAYIRERFLPAETAAIARTVLSDASSSRASHWDGIRHASGVA